MIQLDIPASIIALNLLNKFNIRNADESYLMSYLTSCYVNVNVIVCYFVLFRGSCTSFKQKQKVLSTIHQTCEPTRRRCLFWSRAAVHHALENGRASAYFMLIGEILMLELSKFLNPHKLIFVSLSSKI